MDIMKKKRMIIAASVAGLIAATGAAFTQSAQAEDKVACYGVNACKGTGECGGKGHSCAGKNACKGAGVVMMAKDACLGTQGGRLTEEA